ncbi:MAG: sensor histidine kinase [Firmicutes bacterium]|nr:sensor histidine kinase [Bacillota bacterium]
MLYERTASSLTASLSYVQDQIDDLDNITFNMIASESVQTSVKTYMESDNAYTKKTQIDNINSYLVRYIFNEKNIFCVHYLINDVLNVSGNMPSTLLASKRESLINGARAREGRGYYEFSADHKVLYYARQIREADPLTLDELLLIIIEVNLKNESAIQAGDQFRIVSIDEIGESFPVVNQSIQENKRPGREGYNIFRVENEKTYVTWKISSDGKWVYMLLSSYSKMYGRIVIIETAMLAITLIILLVMIIETSNSLKKTISPLDQFIRKIRNTDIENIDLEEEMNLYSSRPDEIGDLFRSFDSMSRKTKQLFDENYRARMLANESRLKALQMQIHPHFLYNTLDSIHFMAVINKQTEISSLVQSLATLLRHTINNKSDIVDLREELLIANEYLHIQKIRFEDRLEWMIEVPEELKAVSIPLMTLQPLVENAIKYNLETNLTVCRISIYARQEGEECILFVHDNGQEGSPEYMQEIANGNRTTETSSIGLYNIHQRIHLLFGEQYGLSFSKDDTGMTVGIHLPIKNTGGSVNENTKSEQDDE